MLSSSSREFTCGELGRPRLVRDRIPHVNGFLQAKSAREAKGKNNYNSCRELKLRWLLLPELPGNTLNEYEFEHIIGQSFTKSNQINSVKDLSSNLQNIFKLNRNKTDIH